MKTVAVVSDKQLGDVTLLEPLTRLLAEQSGTPCAMFVKDAFRPLIELMPFASWGPSSKLRHYLSITTSWSSRAVTTTIKLNARRRVLITNQNNQVRWWYRLFFHEILIEPIGAEYWAHYFWRVLGGKLEAFQKANLQQPPITWSHSSLPNKPYILINPTAAWPTKYWLADRWASVIHHLLARGFVIVLTGGSSPPEIAHCADITQLVPDQSVVSFVGSTSLQEYIHAISRASLVLCVDGSASHLAQAFDVPTLTLFGPVYPVKWHCPSDLHRAVSAFDCTSSRPPSSADLTLEAVMSVLTSLLKEHPEIVC